MPATPAWPPKSAPRLFVPGPLAPASAVELGGAQQFELGGVSEVRLAAEAAHGFDVIRADVERGEGHATRVEHAPHDLTHATEARDHHARFLGVGDRIEPGFHLGTQSRRDDVLVDEEEHRRQRHGQRHRNDEEVDRLRWQHFRGQCFVEQHERELTGVAEQYREAARAFGSVAGEAADRVEDRRLDDHEPQGGADDLQRV